MIVREATAADGEGLGALQARCPRGTNLILSRANQPDFFARARTYARARVFLAEVEGQIVGCGTACVRTGVLGDGLDKVGSELEYLVDPERRGQGIARAIRGRVEEWLIAEGAVHSTALIPEGDVPSLRLFEGQGFRLARRLRQVDLRPRRELAVRARGTVRPLASGDVPALTKLLYQTWRGHDLFEPVSPAAFRQTLDRLIGFDLVDIRVLERRGNVVAALGAWETSAVIRFTVEAAPSDRGGILDRLRRARSAPSPRLGDVLTRWALLPIAFREPEDLTPLFQQLNNDALRGGADQLFLVAEPDSPILAAARDLARTDTDLLLNAKPFDDLSLGDRPVCVSAMDL